MKLRFGFFYTVGWLVFAALYAVILLGSSDIPPLDALQSALFTVFPAAIAGLLVWRTSNALVWTGRQDVARILGLHALAAVVYAAFWTGSTIAQIALFAPEPVLDMFLRRAAGWQFLMGLMVYALIAGVAYLIQMTSRLGEQRVLASRAELQALRAQLNPHFLFNTLHSVTALLRDEPAVAENALVRFGSLLRYVLDASGRADDDTTVEDELNFVRGYLELETLRLGARLVVVEDIDPDALDCLIPVLTLQPLVENAVRHGIAPQAHGGEVRISARLSDDDLVIVVSDDGRGSTDDAMAAAGGVGLALVKRRIAARFPDDSSVLVEPSPRGFAVTVTVPAQAMTREQIEAAVPWHVAPRDAERVSVTA